MTNEGVREGMNKTEKIIVALLGVLLVGYI